MGLADYSIRLSLKDQRIKLSTDEIHWCVHRCVQGSARGVPGACEDLEVGNGLAGEFHPLCSGLQTDQRGSSRSDVSRASDCVSLYLLHEDT